MEFLNQVSNELVPTPEAPRNVVLFTLPEIRVGIDRIRLAMHTDTTMGFLRCLRNLPEIDALTIEGRCLDRSQRLRLTSDPTFNFFMQGRLQRASATSDTDFLGYVLPSNINIDASEARSLISTGFSPRSLAEKIGYRVGFYKARDLISAWEQNQLVSDITDMIAGCNELLLGSDTLSREQLQRISEEIQRHLSEEQGNILANRRPIPPKPIARFVPLTQLFPKDWKLSYMNNYIDKKSKYLDYSYISKNTKEILQFPTYQFKKFKELDRS